MTIIKSHNLINIIHSPLQRTLYITLNNPNSFNLNFTENGSNCLRNNSKMVQKWLKNGGNVAQKMAKRTNAQATVNNVMDGEGSSGNSIMGISNFA